MSKALTRAQADLNALKAEIEAWLATQPPEAVAAARAAALQSTAPKPVRKPAIKRTRAQLLEAATAPVVVTEEPTPVVEPAPLWIDATHLVHISLVPEYVPRRTAPPRDLSTRRTFRKAFLDGYRG